MKSLEEVSMDAKVIACGTATVVYLIYGTAVLFSWPAQTSVTTDSIQRVIWAISLDAGILPGRLPLSVWGFYAVMSGDKMNVWCLEVASHLSDVVFIGSRSTPKSVLPDEMFEALEAIKHRLTN